jgi:hypothetical protein
MCSRRSPMPTIREREAGNEGARELVILIRERVTGRDRGSEEGIIIRGREAGCYIQ